MNGFHGARTALIAARARVAEGTIYRYFESKDILIRETYRGLEERFYRMTMKGYSAGEPLRERFVYIGGVFVRHCLAFPMDFRFLEQFHNSPYGAAHRRDKVLAKETDILRDLFDEARRLRVVKNLPDPVLFALGFAPLLGVIRDHILGFISLDEGLIKGTIDACWDAVKYDGDGFPPATITRNGRPAAKLNS